MKDLKIFSKEKSHAKTDLALSANEIFKNQVFFPRELTRHQFLYQVVFYLTLNKVNFPTPFVQRKDHPPVRMVKKENVMACLRFWSPVVSF